MRYILTLLLLSATMFRTAAQENYTLADTLTLDAVVVTGVTLTSMTDEGNLRFNVSKVSEENTQITVLIMLQQTLTERTQAHTPAESHTATEAGKASVMQTG